MIMLLAIDSATRVLSLALHDGARIQAGRGRVCAGTYRWNAVAWESREDLQIASWESILESIESETMITGEIDPEGHQVIQRAADHGNKPIQVAAPAFGLRRAGFLAE